MDAAALNPVHFSPRNATTTDAFSKAVFELYVCEDIIGLAIDANEPEASLNSLNEVIEM